MKPVVSSFYAALQCNSSCGLNQFKNGKPKYYSASVRCVWHTGSVSAEVSLESLMSILLVLPPVSKECKVEFLRLDDQSLVATLWEG